jgi:hypothetical protein
MNPHELMVDTQDALAARRVFGEPIHVNGVTVIPAATVRGGARGRATDDGGIGIGLSARPAGIYVVRSDGHVSWRPAVDVNRVILGGQIVAITALFVLRPIIERWGHLAQHADNQPH